MQNKIFALSLIGAAAAAMAPAYEASSAPEYSAPAASATTYACNVRKDLSSPSCQRLLTSISASSPVPQRCSMHFHRRLPHSCDPCANFLSRCPGASHRIYHRVCLQPSPPVPRRCSVHLHCWLAHSCNSNGFFHRICLQPSPPIPWRLVLHLHRWIFDSRRPNILS